MSNKEKLSTAIIVSTLSDGELVQRCLKGDALAQKQFYERFAGRMLGICYRYAGNLHEAEDWWQEGFIRAFRYLKDYRNEGSLEGWLHRIMVSTSINMLKREKIIRGQEVIETASLSADDSCNILVRLEWTEVISLIRDLSPGYRTVLNLFAVEGFSHKEIGDLLGITESTSRSQYMRAKQILLKKIEEHFSYGLTHERTGREKRV